MTLFMCAAPEEPLFRQVLDRYFNGLPRPSPTSASDLAAAPRQAIGGMRTPTANCG